jgi:hypothetical protein
MVIDDLACATNAEGRRLSATVTWEDRDFPSEQLVFEFFGPPPAGDGAASECYEDACPDAFLTACFPLAAVYGETRVRIDANPCPMLVEGLHLAHSWWSLWGGMPHLAPRIETGGRDRRRASSGKRRGAVGFLSGGVDSLHMLMRNRQLYRPGDAAYIRDVLFIHGFDIGKRRRNPESIRYQAAFRRLEPVAAETGARLVACRTNLRHLRSPPDFWEDRHTGAALAAVAHAATLDPAFAFIGGTYTVANAVPSGSHPAVDSLFSSQRVGVIHDGARFTRCEKVSDIASWTTALSALRVCPGTPEDGAANCGRCEKCLCTRLELLAAGVEETEAFGQSLTPLDLWDDIPPGEIGERIAFYEELLPQLRRLGFDALCSVIEDKIATHLGRGRRRLALA